MEVDIIKCTLYRSAVVYRNDTDVRNTAIYQVMFSDIHDNHDEAELSIQNMVQNALKNISSMHKGKKFIIKKIGTSYYIKEDKSIIGFIGVGYIDEVYQFDENVWQYKEFSIERHRNEYNTIISIRNKNNKIIEEKYYCTNNKENFDILNDVLNLIESYIDRNIKYKNLKE